MSEENKTADKQEQKKSPIKTWSEGQEFLCPLLLDYIVDLCNYSLEEVVDDRNSTAAIAHAIAELARFYIDTGGREDKELPEGKAEASKDNTKAKKISDEIRGVYPYTKWVEALDGITELEWLKVKKCIDSQFKLISEHQRVNNVLSVANITNFYTCFEYSSPYDFR